MKHAKPADRVRLEAIGHELEALRTHDELTIPRLRELMTEAELAAGDDEEMRTWVRKCRAALASEPPEPLPLFE